MLKFAADEGFNWDILRELRRRNPDLDIATVQERGMRQTEDPSVLEWAAREGRILLTSDAQTMLGFAYERVRKGESVPGVFVVPANCYRVGGRRIELIAGASGDGEWEGRVEFLPLKR